LFLFVFVLKGVSIAFSWTRFFSLHTYLFFLIFKRNGNSNDLSRLQGTRVRVPLLENRFWF
jgi:hypothetical protein